MVASYEEMLKRRAEEEVQVEASPPLPISDERLVRRKLKGESSLQWLRLLVSSETSPAL